MLYWNVAADLCETRQTTSTNRDRRQTKSCQITTHTRPDTKVKQVSKDAQDTFKENYHEEEEFEALTLSRTQPLLDPRIILSFDCESIKQRVRDQNI